MHPVRVVQTMLGHVAQTTPFGTPVLLLRELLPRSGMICGVLVHWPETAFWEMAPPCTCRESPCDQENTRCWKMTVARGSEMKAQIEPLVETDCR
jgi:hypothetical protein